MGTLTGAQIQQLALSLNSALNLNDLEDYVQASTGDGLYDVYVGPGKPKLHTITDLLNVLQQLGTTVIFLAYVYEKRPGRPDVRALIAALFPEVLTVPGQKIDLSAQTAGAPQEAAPTNAVAPGLQRNVRPYLAKLDVRIWQDRLVKIERQVCRVELDGNPVGTGFLVGPDTVLTNWHVFEVAKNAGKVDQLGCRFDYVRLPGGQTDPGQLVMLTGADSIDASPYSAAEKANKNDPLPTLEELDFALLRLNTRVGGQQIDGAPRGWIALPKAVLPLPADAPILIVQHPRGSPMKLALDTQAVIGPNGNGTRVRYRTNTDPGSSGSPVFTMDWDLVALHHSGDPNLLNPAFNEGIPIELIRQHIVNGGFDNALGA